MDGTRLLSLNVCDTEMAIQSQRIEPHWNYLLALDAELVTLSRYVDFSEQNFNCFSIEIVRILLAAAAEVDIVCKQLNRGSSLLLTHKTAFATPFSWLDLYASNTRVPITT